jgi:hypothetical protein
MYPGVKGRTNELYQLIKNVLENSSVLQIKSFYVLAGVSGPLVFTFLRQLEHFSTF